MRGYNSIINDLKDRLAQALLQFLVKHAEDPDKIIRYAHRIKATVDSVVTLENLERLKADEGYTQLYKLVIEELRMRLADTPELLKVLNELEEEGFKEAFPGFYT